MSTGSLGIEGYTDEDARFAGSRFATVRDAIFAEPYQKVWGAPGEPPLPIHKVTLGIALRGILPFGQPYGFLQAARRAVDSMADLRWGPDRKGYRRILHTNGVCLTGRWEITEDTPYTGYFAKGSQGLIVGRYSTCCTETRRGHTRSLSLVARIYPTADPEHAEPLPTANFITQEDIGGDWSATINDAVLRNAPNTHLLRRGLGAPVLLVTGAVFAFADKMSTFRQVYQIAELGKSEGEPTRAPEFMQLKVDPAQPRIPGEGLDFRDEVMAQIYDPGDPQPKRTLTFRIETSDEGETHGFNGNETRTIKNWREIGKITFDRSVVSYNGDFVVHFNHPVWRFDRNDPTTANVKAPRR